MGKKKGDAHHGGAWKVAYADFVTAMMALFMVLWILSQDPEVIAETARYFQDPFMAFDKNAASGLLPEHVAGTQKQASQHDPEVTANEGFLRAVARDFTRLLNVKTEEDSPVDVELTADGLKITIFNRDDRPLFRERSSELTEWGNFVLQNLAWLIERHAFRVYIDGHTANWDGPRDPQFGPWELSVERANVARRTLEHFAVEPEKIERVTGYGSTNPLPNVEPNAPRNERITISLSAEPDVSLLPGGNSDSLSPPVNSVLPRPSP